MTERNDGKIGVFICTGYGIAEALNIDALLKVAEKECKVDFTKTIESCEGDDLEFIQQNIPAHPTYK
jgi:quinone-modifying oxidoreductase subunit QmoB